MFATRVNHHILNHRFDPEHYSPEAVKLDKQLYSLRNGVKLRDIVNQKRTITNGVLGPDLLRSQYKMVRLQDCKEWEVLFDECLTISKNQFYENKRCRLYIDDVIVAIGGYLGRAAIVAKNDLAVIGQHSAILPFGHKTSNDPRFLLAYLNSYYGKIQFGRWSRGTVQPGLNLEDVGEIAVTCPRKEAQTYIGNKVRQAELLRKYSRLFRELALGLVENVLAQTVEEKK